MLVIEKYKEEIENFDDSDSLCCYLAQMVTKQGDRINCSRKGVGCSECLKLSLLDLIKEYKEPIKLNFLEHAYLKEAIESNYKYIICDKDGHKYFYKDKPFKSFDEWLDNRNTFCGILDSLFNFVKWEDEEPYSIDSILSNCEVIENEES